MRSSLYSTQVAALATLAILRVIAASSSSSSKENENVSIKCITFSQPPVGNAALKEYVFPELFFFHILNWLAADSSSKLQN